MKEIAAEHNIEWDSSDFEAKLLKAPENLLDGPPTFLEAHEMPPPTNKSHVKPLDNDSLAPSTSELAPPPLTQSSPTVQELLKQDDKKQFIHFVKMLAAGKNEWPVPPAPTVVCNTPFMMKQHKERW